MDKDTMALGPSGVDSALFVEHPYGFDELSYLLKGVFVASPPYDGGHRGAIEVELRGKFFIRCFTVEQDIPNRSAICAMV
ncbi:hypothetical protein T231_09510 [Tannerella sp. oral taxon BU063 isolate Cell 6/7/9]|uniref:Uncharacterized protein n=1 Tax=Tannerella sp. oral taxon BU063 isolate Cell 6/7/9 TaxID=1411021 RepID=W2CQL5_9BACT|nr:hypothetical protein T231_09510 [Tannerella sp. oral taxon BU063 isolate Cell 6/7/9]